MFAKKSYINLEGFTAEQIITFAASLAKSFPAVTFGITANRVSVKGPRQTVDQIIAAAATL